MLGRHFPSKFYAPPPLPLNSELLQDVLQHTTIPVLHFHEIRSQTKSTDFSLIDWSPTFKTSSMPHFHTYFVSGDKDFSFCLLHASKLQIMTNLSEQFSEFQDPQCHLLSFFTLFSIHKY